MQKLIPYNLQSRGQLLDLSQPIVMGILNTTPDSFFDGGRYQQEIAILKRAEQILEEGGKIIDIGGYSTRPGADDISEEEELQRVVPIIEKISQEFPEAWLSIDTFRSKVAKESVEAGANLINDISGGNADEKMFETVANLDVPYILMHSRGNPQTMKNLATYEDVTLEVIRELEPKLEKLRKLKVKDVIIDPGFGFAKNIQQNFELFSNLEAFEIFQLPLLVGISRKSMIYKTLQQENPQEALNGTTVLNTLALQKGANILRVHDVREAREIIELRQRI